MSTTTATAMPMADGGSMAAEADPRGCVHFVGAGPGDPELLTMKACRLIAAADVIIYAGSLIDGDVLGHARPDAQVHDSAHMTLDEQVSIMSQAAAAGQTAVRLHSGDPTIYGAIAEQMRRLRAHSIPYRVVPGVTSATAAAAELGIEYTVPGDTQTLILTRLAGKTPVPVSEALTGLAAHRSSMAIFLSTGMIEQVVDGLYAAGYPPDTPVAVVFRATWPDQKVIRGTLASIGEQLRAAEITHQGLIIVSPALRSAGETPRQDSHLYGTAQVRPPRAGTTAVVALTRNGTETGARLHVAVPGSVLYAPSRFLAPADADRPGVEPFTVSVRQVLQDAFQAHASLVCVMAGGIAVRDLAPLLRSKHSDPAVVLVDEAGRFAVSLISGHLGGANALAEHVAAALGGTAVITTASDVQGLPALDLLGAKWGWQIEPCDSLTAASAALVNGDPVAVWQEEGESEWWPQPAPGNLQRYETLADLLAAGPSAALLITSRLLPAGDLPDALAAVIYRPRCLAVGVGCNRGSTEGEILAAVDTTLANARLSAHSVRCVATVEDKRDEPGLIAACAARDWSLEFLPRSSLAAVTDLPNPSPAAQAALGVPGVAEPAALLAAGATRLLVEKRKWPNVTVAVARVSRGCD